MKKKQLAMIKNVIAANKSIEYLLNRPTTEMAGLCLWHGDPGIGKTRFAKVYASQNNQIYIRLETTSTAKTFAVQLHQALCEKHHSTAETIGSINKVFRLCRAMIKMLPGLVIFIDEVDTAFKKKTLLGSIRDLVDETDAVVVLLGMQTAYSELLKSNAHYFDRCNYFVKFLSLNYADVKLVIEKISDVKMSATIINAIHNITMGNLRKVIKQVYALETVAKKRSLSEIEFEDVKGLF